MRKGLTQEDNQRAGNSWTWTYDDAGNILSDGKRTYTWEHGRELATVAYNGSTWTNTYDADGMRTARKGGSTAYSYVYNGGQLSQMTVGSNTLYFAYDASGTPLSVTYNGTAYYYATNLQGDITAILNTSGTAVVTYTYDAWGNILTTGGSMASTLGTHNPLRYRGYVYDTETGLYYLQSRYYDPEMGRFTNADILISTGQGLLGNNMFAFCNNNPINLSDHLGSKPEEAIDTDGDGKEDCYVYVYTYEIGILWWKNTKTGRVYIYTNVIDEEAFKELTAPDGFVEGTDLLVGDWTTNNNPTMYAYQAHKVDQKHRSKIVDILFEYVEDFGKSWERTRASVMTEWKEHHRYSLFSARAQNIDFDEEEEGAGFWYFLKKAFIAVIK